jgi:ribosomal protein S18 acetylase RimI-like enzyme
VNDRELHLRGLRTAYAAWEVFAAGADGASVRHGPGYIAAVFPTGPEAEFLNNAVLDRGLSPDRLSSALGEVEDGYADIEAYAVWVTDDDPGARAVLEARGFGVDTSTASMAVELTGPLPARAYDPGPDDWAAYVAHEGGLLAGADPHAFRVATALLDGEVVAAAIGFEHDGDLGIYNVGTREHARRRGLATALTTGLVNAAVERGCTTATLQATPMAERVYAACGFRTMARIVEYVPAAGQAAGQAAGA